MNDVNNVFIEDWALSLGLFIFSTNETSRQQKSVLIKLSDPSGNCASAITKGQVAGCVPCCQQPAFSLAPSTERRHHSLYHNLDKSVIFFVLKSICRYLSSPSGIFQKVGGSPSNLRQNQTKLEAVHSVVILENISVSFCRTTGSEALMSSLNPWNNIGEMGWFTSTDDVCHPLPLILWKLLLQQTK